MYTSGAVAEGANSLGASEEENALAALRQSEELYARAFIQNPIPMSLTHAETGRFTAVNEEFLQLVGYYRAELIGRTSRELELWPSYGEREQVGERLARGSIVGPLHGTVRRKGGGERRCTSFFRLLESGAGTWVLSVLVPADD